MAKARKKKSAKRAGKKRKAVRKVRKPARRKARRAKSRRGGSLLDVVGETAALRQRLAGHNTFED